MRISKKRIERWKRGVRGEKQMEVKDFEEKKKKTYTQNWISYNLAQTQEFSLFQDILIELIDNTLEIRNPLWKNGRPFSDLKDMIFCCVMRVYFDKSSRRSVSFLTLAKGKNYINKIPHFNTMLNYYRNPHMTNILKHLIEQSGIPLKEMENNFTVDSSGFSTSLYGRWLDVRIGSMNKRRLFRKAHVTSGVKINIISAVDISKGYYHDSPFFEGLMKVTAKNYNMREISADAAYSSKYNLKIVEELGAIPYIMFRNNVTGKRCRGSLMWKKMFRFYKEHRNEFLEHYHQRSNAESVFNMIKRKMGTHLNCKTETAQDNELLCKILAHNICVLISELFEANTYLNYEEAEKLRCSS